MLVMRRESAPEAARNSSRWLDGYRESEGHGRNLLQRMQAPSGCAPPGARRRGTGRWGLGRPARGCSHRLDEQKVLVPTKTGHVLSAAPKSGPPPGAKDSHSPRNGADEDGVPQRAARPRDGVDDALRRQIPKAVAKEEHEDLATSCSPFLRLTTPRMGHMPHPRTRSSRPSLRPPPHQVTKDTAPAPPGGRRWSFPDHRGRPKYRWRASGSTHPPVALSATAPHFTTAHVERPRRQRRQPRQPPEI